MTRLRRKHVRVAHVRIWVHANAATQSWVCAGRDGLGGWVGGCAGEMDGWFIAPIQLWQLLDELVTLLSVDHLPIGNRRE